MMAFMRIFATVMCSTFLFMSGSTARRVEQEDDGMHKEATPHKHDWLLSNLAQLVLGTVGLEPLGITVGEVKISNDVAGWTMNIECKTPTIHVRNPDTTEAPFKSENLATVMHVAVGLACDLKTVGEFAKWKLNPFGSKVWKGAPLCDIKKLLMPLVTINVETLQGLGGVRKQSNVDIFQKKVQKKFGADDGGDRHKGALIEVNRLGEVDERVGELKEDGGNPLVTWSELQDPNSQCLQTGSMLTEKGLCGLVLNVDMKIDFVKVTWTGVHTKLLLFLASRTRELGLVKILGYIIDIAGLIAFPLTKIRVLGGAIGDSFEVVGSAIGGGFEVVGASVGNMFVNVGDKLDKGGKAVGNSVRKGGQAIGDAARQLQFLTSHLWDVQLW